MSDNVSISNLVTWIEINGSACSMFGCKSISTIACGLDNIIDMSASRTCEGFVVYEGNDTHTGVLIVKGAGKTNALTKE